MPTTGRSEEDKVGTLGEPAVGVSERHDLGLGDHGHGFEVEAIQGFARWQAGHGEVAFDAAPGQPSRSACSVNWGQTRMALS
jgi:hypothetical protein